jgi:hypothetical protein
VSPQFEPLPGDVAQLLSRGATQLEPSAHARRRLRERLAAEIRGQGGSPLALAPRGPIEGLASRALRSRLLIGLASFALGAGASAVAGSSSSRGPATRAAATPASFGKGLTVLPQPAPVLAAAPASAVPTAPLSVAPAHPDALDPRTHHAVARAFVTVPGTPPVASTAPLSPPPAKSELRLEGELLERGRIAMVRGDAEGALAAADEHALRFPSGKLAEEREALRVQALASEDRLPEARAALGAFRRAYPASLVGPALETAVTGR